jgi:uncharacterized membrane protein
MAIVSFRRASTTRLASSALVFVGSALVFVGSALVFVGSALVFVGSALVFVGATGSGPIIVRGNNPLSVFRVADVAAGFEIDTDQLNSWGLAVAGFTNRLPDVIGAAANHASHAAVSRFAAPGSGTRP